MAAERQFDPDKSVPDVIVDLLLTTLPPELRVSAPDLADRVIERPDVAPHAGKRWGELSEGEGNIVAREVGIVARYVAQGAGSTAASGSERLH